MKGTSLFTKHKQLKLYTSISYQLLMVKEVLLTYCYRLNTEVLSEISK